MLKKIVISVLMLMLAYTAYAGAEEYVVKFNGGIIPAGCEESVVYSGYDGVYITCDEAIREKYGDYIEYFEPNREIYLIEDVKGISALSVPVDKYYHMQWQTHMIDADSAWESETYGNGINVAVIDSGVSHHPDITENIKGGYCYVTNSLDYSDNEGHGTHVAGIIAAAHNTSGVAGIAPKVNIYALKCIEPNVTGTELMLARAIKGAVDDFNCQVINLSLGTPVNSSVVYDAVKYAYSKGAIIIAAAGNSYNSTLMYPAAYEEVIGVGSVEMNKDKSDYSQYNKSVFVVAPGRSVIGLHTKVDGVYRYAQRSGTSQAAPLVSGAAAVMLSADRSVNDAKFRELIKETSEDLGDEGYDYYFGHGLIDIGRMLEKLTGQYPCYISPVNDGRIMIHNRSEDIITAIGIIAEYSDSELVCADFTDLVIMPDTKIKIPVAPECQKSKYYLWDAKALEPFAKDREL